MASKDISVLSLVGSLVLAAVMAASGVDAYKALNEKALAQITAVEDLREWKRQYDRLIPVEERWNASLKTITEAKDLLTIHGLLSANAPGTDPDTLLVGSITRLMNADRDLGAQKICLTSSGAGLTFTEKTFPALLFGLQALSARADVSIGTLTLTQVKGLAKASASPVCLLLRDPPTSKANP